MHEVKVKSILSAKNGMNIYRGCTHGCIYCDARSLCYNMQHKFEDVEVKINAPELLRQALKKKRKPCMIGTGAMSDPYIPLEKELELTRRCLEIIDEYGFGVTMQTKSDLVLRDLDLLKSINKKNKCVVQMTITTADDALCKKTEPHVCPTSRRKEVLEILKKEGIPTVVWMSPILPFINDTKENILRIVDICAECGVKGIITFGIGTTMRDGSREHFYKQLDKSFPGLRPKYEKTYMNVYEVPSPNARELYEIFKKKCENYKMEYDINKIFTYLNEFEDKFSKSQLSLFDF